MGHRDDLSRQGRGKNGGQAAGALTLRIRPRRPLPRGEEEQPSIRRRHPLCPDAASGHLPLRGRNKRGARSAPLLLTAHCSLLTAHCSLLTAHCSLLTAHCSLLTAHCSLLTAHCCSEPRFHRGSLPHRPLFLYNVASIPGLALTPAPSPWSPVPCLITPHTRCNQ